MSESNENVIETKASILKGRLKCTNILLEHFIVPNVKSPNEREREKIQQDEKG